MSEFIRLDREELVRRRDALLASVPYSHEELKARARRSDLTPEQMDVAYTLEGLEWLLEG